MSVLARQSFASFDCALWYKRLAGCCISLWRPSGSFSFLHLLLPVPACPAPFAALDVQHACSTAGKAHRTG